MAPRDLDSIVLRLVDAALKGEPVYYRASSGLSRIAMNWGQINQGELLVCWQTGPNEYKPNNEARYILKKGKKLKPDTVTYWHEIPAMDALTLVKRHWEHRKLEHLWNV